MNTAAGGNMKFLAILAAALVGAGVASSAARADGGLIGCDGETQRAFAQFGDYAQYRLVPGGDFETGAAGWSLSGGARIVPGNESFAVRGGSHSLSLPAGSSATSPPLCAGITDPTLRFFQLSTGASSGSLQVEVLFRTVLGILPMKLTVGTQNGTSVWAPSQTMLNVGALLGSLSLDLKGSVQFRFTPKSALFAPASYRIDDVFVDPFGLGNSG